MCPKIMAKSHFTNKNDLSEMPTLPQQTPSGPERCIESSRLAVESFVCHGMLLVRRTFL